MLELVTGKRPTDPTFVKRGLNVVGWVSSFIHIYAFYYSAKPCVLDQNLTWSSFADEHTIERESIERLS